MGTVLRRVGFIELWFSIIVRLEVCEIGLNQRIHLGVQIQLREVDLINRGLSLLAKIMTKQ